MFERYLTDALTTYFGNFVENLDVDKVRLSAWKGELVLQDLHIRHDALDSFIKDCPVEISYGRIGNLELCIPWKTVRSQLRWSSSTSESISATNLECFVILSDVHILMTPKTRRRKRTRQTEDEELSLEQQRVQKEHDVQRLLDAQLFERVAKSSTVKHHQTSRWQWVRQLVTNLLSSLSVTIRNIHVRFEDEGMGFITLRQARHVRESFAIGITLHQFSVQTLDSMEEGNLQEAEEATKTYSKSFSIRQKLAAASQLAVYWDRGKGCHLMSSNVHDVDQDISHMTDVDSSGTPLRRAEERKYFACAFAVLNGDESSDFVHSHLYDTQHTYVLSPVSPSTEIALVTDNRSEEDTVDNNGNDDDDETDSRDSMPARPLIPPSGLNMAVPPCRLAISATTLEDTAYIRKSLAIWNRTRKSSISEASVRRLTSIRPNTSVMEDPPSWWRYAMEATLVLEGRDSGGGRCQRRRGWLGLAQAIKRRRDYVSLYEKVLYAEKEIERETAHLDLFQMEDDLLVSEIVAFRLAAYAMVSKAEPSVDEDATSRTWAGWVRGKKDDPVEASFQDAVTKSFDDSDLLLEATGIMQLSLDHRRKMYSEMVEMLEREKDNQTRESSFRESIANGSHASDARTQNSSSNAVIWSSCVAFKELSFQINERIVSRMHGYQQRPVLRLSCALMQEQTLYLNDAWDVNSYIASLQVVDMTGGPSPSPGTTFPILLGRKRQTSATAVNRENGIEDVNTVTIDGEVLPLCAHVSISRTIECHAGKAGNVMDRETTCTVIRLLPLEVVYSTNPIAGLNRALSTAKTSELTDDYHRMVQVMSRWRSRQKTRLLRALAHKRKKIVVDVAIAAPVFLIPEDPANADSPLLVVDLGHLKLVNSDEKGNEMTSDYDDNWKLTLSKVHVECSSMETYRRKQVHYSKRRCDSDIGCHKSRELVEPFSLHFVISTRFGGEESGALTSRETIVDAEASLPRLVLNLTSSAVRLVKRLQLNWVLRNRVPSSNQVGSCNVRTSIHHDSDATSSSDETGSVVRRIKFSFSAPLIGFRLENDVDGRDYKLESGSDDPDLGRRRCPLVDLALRGIRGELIQTRTSSTKSTNSFDARLRSVAAVDLYQNAGEDFAFLLSSFPPSTFAGKFSTFLRDATLKELEPSPVELAANDLVSVSYVGSSNVDHPRSTSREMHLEDTLAIGLRELFVEWNPETIAAIHKGMSLPIAAERMSTSEPSIDFAGGKPVDEQEPNGIDPKNHESDSDDEFYDAVGAADERNSSFMTPVRDGETGVTQSISEVSSCSSSSSSAASDLASQPHLSFDGTMNPSSPFLRIGLALPLVGGRLNLLDSNVDGGRPRPSLDTQSQIGTISKRSVEVTFKLSALRVNFNKDSRRRRLFTAEMDDTDVLYSLHHSERSKTTARIGNLCVTDPSSTANMTLYKEILGLKSSSFDIPSAKLTSLLEMELCVNPRRRRLLSSNEFGRDVSAVDGVAIDCRTGNISGADISLSLRLSPMRFVYLQQLWMEIIDYFFEAIVGYEVWGRVRPSYSSDLTILMTTPGDKSQPRDLPRILPSALKKELPGVLAEEFSFTRFDVRMDEPMVLIPVSYRSPHFLRLDFRHLTASNYYLGKPASDARAMEDKITRPTERVQWYNNCEVELDDLRLTTWDGAEVSDSRFESGAPAETKGARIRINWPVGPWARSVIPKWNVDCDLDRVVLFLRRENYALLQHIIQHNIGELSRHLDEWDALQNLPTLELERYKSEIMVHFGYDKKDTAPTTYAITLKVPSVKFFLLAPSAAHEDTVMEADCTGVEWQMSKLLDRIGRQKVTCDIALSKPEDRDNREAGTVDLLLPVYNSDSTDAETQSRELVYESTTRPSGDNVRQLEIVNAWIFASYPAWVNVMRFFTGLPEPDVMNPDEVGLAIEIGDRWYKIGANHPSEAQPEHALSSEKNEVDPANMPIQQRVPSYQFRLLLRSPSIVLSSEPANIEKNYVVLHMDHFDFFHRSDALSRKITKTFFVHDLELHTSSGTVLVGRDGFVDENSLIHPWCVTGQYERSNAQKMGPCDGHDLRIMADVLQARAAYSDMSVAINVGLNFLSDIERSGPPRNKVEEKNQGKDNDVSDKEKLPGRYLMAMELVGFELLVIDDSMRHFAGAQKLVQLSFGDVSCYQITYRQESEVDVEKRRTKLSLHTVNIFDCLQPVRSPFRLVATSQEPTNDRSTHRIVSDTETSSHRMSWLDFQTLKDNQWGFCVSRFLSRRIQSHELEYFLDSFDSTECNGKDVCDDLNFRRSDFAVIQHLFVEGISDDYSVNLRSLAMQWNPSTVIALQRFLGRLHKEAKTKSEREWPVLSSSSSADLARARAGSKRSDALPTNALFRMERLIMSLNKEHQNRCLVKVSLSDSQVHFEHKASRGISVHGFIRDFSAFDTDTYSGRGPKAILEENRHIIRVMASDGKDDDVPTFLRLRFNTFACSDPISSCSDLLPFWVKSHFVGLGMSSTNDIDDFLSVSIATVWFCYIRERTEEILDYLSNGLPGKGMGATSRAAKGFINKRIQTRSFLELNIQAPQVYVPRSEKSYRGISVRLGDAKARSWFEENALSDIPDVDNSTTSQAAWYRVLSLSLTGLYWNAHEKSTPSEPDSGSTDVVPLDINLNVRKATRKGSATVVKGSLSCIDLTLTYSAYMLLRAVMRDNISREIDVTRWDNVEKAYWIEEGDHDQPSYSSNARFIHYGYERMQKVLNRELKMETAATSKDMPVAAPKLDCLFILDGLRLKLHRNDRLEGLDSRSKQSDFASTFSYDMVVLRADRLEVSFNSNSLGDKSLQMSLGRLAVFDLGDSGRLARARYCRTLQKLDSCSDFVEKGHRASRNPCAFSVLVEGYDPMESKEERCESRSHLCEEPQLLLTVDTCSASSAGMVRDDLVSDAEINNDKIVLARMVFNYLSINALTRPIKEILAFLACSWPFPRAVNDGDTSQDVVDDLGEERGRDVEQVEDGSKTTSTRKGFQLKVVAHYPRIFFLADESDPCSRALVLRGLAVLDTSILDQKTMIGLGHWNGSWADEQSKGFCDGKVVTTVNAQLQSMETYIDPNVESALGVETHNADAFDRKGSTEESSQRSFDRLLGVALIQPVTAGIEFCQVRRDRFPTLESFSANMEPVSLMLSFEDLTLLEAIVERWSSLATSANSTSTQASSSQYDLPSMSEDIEQPSFEIPVSANGSQHAVSFDVTFKESRLGLVLKKLSGAIAVDMLQNTDGAEPIQVGDILTAIDGEAVESSSLDEVVEVLASLPRPVTISFCRELPKYDGGWLSSHSIGLSRSFASHAHESVTEANVDAIANEGIAGEANVYTVTLRRGMLNGLTVQPGPCGGIPIVIDVLPSFFRDAVTVSINGENGSIEVAQPEQSRLPRTGAVVIEIDGKLTSEIGYQGAREALDCLSSKPTVYDELKATTSGNMEYTMKLLELDSSVWGKIKAAEVGIAGIALTFIDDFKGRDMPLLRGRLSNIDVRIERGLGLEPRSIVAAPPDVVDLSKNDVNSLDEITMIHAFAQTEIDYFHPRIAIWEPLLERSNLCFTVEWQLGSARRPGQFAIEASDRSLQSVGRVELNSTPSMTPKIVSLNLTDAAVEVVARAAKEWRDWRMRTFTKQQVDSLSLGNVDTGSDYISSYYVDSNSAESDAGLAAARSEVPASISASTTILGSSDASGSIHETRHAASQKAAVAALVFAQKRGAGKYRKSESSKPFVLKNRTGMALSFIEETVARREQKLADGPVSHNLHSEEERNRPFSQRRKAPTLVEDGSDARFHMDVVDHDEEMSDETQQAKRVRAYEGQYPSLCVILEEVPGMMIKPLKNLPVYKVGNTFTRLEVQRLRSETESVRESAVSTSEVESSIPVVWTVEIEDNRRVLTLSSAVCVISSGVSLSVDIGVALSLRASDDLQKKQSIITKVGTAESGSPFFLPLPLAIKSERVEVYVKPAGLDECSWSKRSVLSFTPTPSFDGASDRTKWLWIETFESACAIPCELSLINTRSSKPRTLWLSCISVPDGGDKIGSKAFLQQRKKRSTRADTALTSIAIDAGLTIRNMLPVNMQWEVAAFEDREVVPLDSSQVRQDGHTYGLLSGEGVEILTCSPEIKDIRARFRFYSVQEWSEWAPLKLRSTKDPQGDDGSVKVTNELESCSTNACPTRQVNVQIQDEFGSPLTMGVRVVPKLAGERGENAVKCFGYDAIIFAELWLRNLTSLPLSFGCPASQIRRTHEREHGQAPQVDADEAGIINAEAALIEIASIFELGERGKGVSLRDENVSTSVSKTCLLPYQTAELIFEEIFEYVEVENSAVKRRWWASETHECMKQEPLKCLEAGMNWVWVDDEWKIDCSGQSIRSSDGWESCRSLIGGKDDYFSRRRTFNTSHPFRRRRWFRRRRQDRNDATGETPVLSPGELYEGINAFHQPVQDSFSQAQMRAEEIREKRERNGESESSGRNDGSSDFVNEGTLKIAIRCADGQWSRYCVVPPSGQVHGIMKVPASRWPTITKLSEQQATELPEAFGTCQSSQLQTCVGGFAHASLSPHLYELCYSVSVLDDDWGELTRIFLVTPRLMLRNDSERLSIEVKQSGSPDEKAIVVEPGDVVPFFWADFRLPELVSLRPVSDNQEGKRLYRWSGGFDVSTLGMTAIRVRRNWRYSEPRKTVPPTLKSIRTLIEIRPGTGGTGINVSFKEEDPSGNGSLFRVENLSPFRIWIAQDGVLANPSALQEDRRLLVNQKQLTDEHAETDGDLIEPGEQTSFALDVPFRQGKYVGRKAATMAELTRIRAGLAPLSSRDGVETTKLVSLSTVGESIKLSPAKLSSINAFDILPHLVDIRVLGIVATDGPTRVLRFCLMRKNDSSGVFDYDIRNIASSGPFRGATGQAQRYSRRNVSRGNDEYIQQLALESAMNAIEMDAPGEDEAKRLAYFGPVNDGPNLRYSSHSDRTHPAVDDTIFSFRAAFCGFSCSLIDKSPSEIALITLKDVSISANWDKQRATEGKALVSVGWLQVDNYVPNAPFPVAVYPDKTKTEGLITENESQRSLDSDREGEASPLLIVGLTFAPKHKSGILCLKSATVAPRDLAVAIDLAFVVRLQQFFVDVHRHLRSAVTTDKMIDRANASLLLLQIETRRFIPFPDIDSMVKQLEGANAAGIGSQKLYFEGLTILPCNVNLSVAPARALTSAQASLEGSEAAALHAAVRKGDVLVGGGMLGVNIGHKNKTAVAVVRGVFKSIVVDALLRCEAASLNFSGVYLRNHISTGPQLKTFLAAHYMESLKSNVPALLGSMAALGNPLGLIRGIGDGMSDFVNEPVKGLKKSIEELDPSYVVGGVARGTESLARHAVGGFAGSASLLAETLSKNMTVITLDRRYAQRRDRRSTLRSPDRDLAVTFFEGVESGAAKLIRGVWDGVSGVVKAPLRGAERHGMEGFAEGVGKGLLGLLVKPMIGLSDAATDVMIGVQGSVEGKSSSLRGSRQAQVRPRRPMYGRDRVLRPYSVADAAAASLMLRTKLGGENYLSHCDMDDQVALLSVKRLLLLGSNGEELLSVKFKNIERVSVQPIDDGTDEWAVVIVQSFPRSPERPVRAIRCKRKAVAVELCSQLNCGVSLANES